ncbi:MAG: trigger factor [Lachnospiraceae bacterium]
MKKKLITWMLIACMAVSVTACGEKEQPADDTQVETDTEKDDTQGTEIDRSALGTSTLNKLGEYKGITYTPTDTTVTDDMVEERIQQLLASSQELVEVTDHDTVTETDVANIDYEGKKDGVAFNGGTAQGYDLDIANSTFIDGFAEGLVGMKVGETKDLNLTFPENYRSEELAGQDVVFTVTVNYISQYVTPELNDGFAAENGYDSVDALYADARASLGNEKQNAANSNMITEVIGKIIDNSEFTVTDEEVQLYMDIAVQQQESMLTAYGLELASYLEMYGTTLEEFKETYREESIYQIKVWLIQSAIAEKEGLEVTEDDYTSFVEEYANYYGYTDSAAFEEAAGRENIENQIIAAKAIAFLAENAVPAEE